MPMGIDVEDLREEILVPAPRGAPPRTPAQAAVRVVGPGRLERGYRARLESLEKDLAERARSLDCAALVERGQARLLDRLEADIERERAANATLAQREKRLILALGALQRENELLRLRARPAEQLGVPNVRRTPARAAPIAHALVRRSWWSRLAARIGGHRDA